jgi:hypothetical protein
MASMTNTPLLLAASNTLRASDAVSAKAFSQRTCFPAAMASRQLLAWKACGVSIYPMSTAGSANTSAYEAYIVGVASGQFFAANARPLSSDEEPMAVMMC